MSEPDLPREVRSFFDRIVVPGTDLAEIQRRAGRYERRRRFLRGAVTISVIVAIVSVGMVVRRQASDGARIATIGPAKGGPAPTVSSQPASPGGASIELRRGAPGPAGYWYDVRLAGFAANSTIVLTCNDSVDPGGFYTQQLVIGFDGTASASTLCYSGDGPLHWVHTDGGLRSNDVQWEDASPNRRRVTITNRVTDGAQRMREDTSPAYLSQVPRNYCKRLGCALPGTDVESGDAVLAECETIGERTTNGNDQSSDDDANPGLRTSTRWIGIRWGDGRFGYVAEVWLDPKMSGQPLPYCGTKPTR